MTTPLVPATAATDDLDPIGLAAMRRLLNAYATVPDLPVAVATTEFARFYANDPAWSERLSPNSCSRMRPVISWSRSAQIRTGSRRGVT